MSELGMVDYFKQHPEELDTFVNLINEDYITSEITGRRYEVKNKKLLDDPEGEPPRG
jgi:hypothetical protein